MRLLAFATAVALAAAASAASNLRAAEPAKRDDGRAETRAPQTPAEIRADLYVRLAASTDADETEGLVQLLLASYGRSGSDTGDLLLRRARKAVAAEDYDDAEQILDAAVDFMPDDAEAWNARATVRYLDDDTDGSMADIAQTLKRDPRHIGALVGMASILQARDKKKEALEVYERVLAIAPHWKKAEEAAGKLKTDVDGQPL